MPHTMNDKLEIFRQAIMEKANAEHDAILKEAEELKRQELDREENRQLEEMYRSIQAQISQIDIANTKEFSRENLLLKKQLYARREVWLGELIEQVKQELAAFTKTKEYLAYLCKTVGELAAERPGEDGLIEVRSADLVHADALAKAYGGACEVRANDREIQVGGVRLLNPARGIAIDRTLDAAVAGQREWFYGNSNFNLE